VFYVQNVTPHNAAVTNAAAAASNPADDDRESLVSLVIAADRLVAVPTD